MPVSRWDPTPYPDPRPNRGLPGEDPGAGGLSVANPRVRRWAATIVSAAVDQQRTVVSPKYTGPALVKKMTYAFALANGLNRQTALNLRRSLDGTGAGAVAAPGPLPGGVDLFDSSFESGGAPTAGPINALQLDDFVTQRNPYEILLDEYITDPEWFLKATFSNPSATAQFCQLVVTIYENVDPDIVIDLLG